MDQARLFSFKIFLFFLLETESIVSFPTDIKDYAPKFELSTKYSLAAGDRTYSSFGHIHQLAHHFISSTHLSDSLIACEESVDLIDEWGVETGVAWMARGTLLPVGTFSLLLFR